MNFGITFNAIQTLNHFLTHTFFFFVFSLIGSQKSYIVFDMLFQKIKKKNEENIESTKQNFCHFIFIYRKNKFTKIDIYCYMVLKIIGKRIYGKDRKTRCFIYLF